MKKVIMTLVSVFVCLNVSYSQTIDDLVKGPIPGYTCTPDAGKFGILTEMVSISTKTMFDEDGNEITLEDLTGGLADPKMSMVNLYLTGEYSLNKNVGFLVNSPFFLKQQVRMNPASGYEDYFTDKNGKIGLGDMTIGGWYFLIKNQIIQFMAHSCFTLATGSSPENVNESEAASTGSGHSSFGVGASADFMMVPKILLSAGGRFTINNKASFSTDGDSWDEKEGNQIHLWGRTSFKVMPNLSTGLDFEYFLKGATKVDGGESSDSDLNYMNITPMVGCQLSLGTSIINITGGYLLHISGKNFPKFNGFLINTMIFF
ncbi:transporter [candidate division WOR-3 bacterium]|nr:transporter [candidate division WOR-3 bacterium]